MRTRPSVRRSPLKRRAPDRLSKTFCKLSLTEGRDLPFFSSRTGEILRWPPHHDSLAVEIGDEGADVVGSELEMRHVAGVHLGGGMIEQIQQLFRRVLVADAR